MPRLTDLIVGCSRKVTCHVNPSYINIRDALRKDGFVKLVAIDDCLVLLNSTAPIRDARDCLDSLAGGFRSGVGVLKIGRSWDGSLLFGVQPHSDSTRAQVRTRLLTDTRIAPLARYVDLDQPIDDTTLVNMVFAEGFRVERPGVFRELIA